MYNIPKQIKGEKYIYLLMATKLCLQSPERIALVGRDNGYVGGQNFERRFRLTEYGGQDILVEIKTSKGFADFSRCFEVSLTSDKNNTTSESPLIREYFNEDGENCSNNWVH